MIHTPDHYKNINLFKISPVYIQKMSASYKDFLKYIARYEWVDREEKRNTSLDKALTTIEFYATLDTDTKNWMWVNFNAEVAKIINHVKNDLGFHEQAHLMSFIHFYTPSTIDMELPKRIAMLNIEVQRLKR